ncbi:MAG: phosphate ABC transporter substrate-binding protein PstS family protein [Anaerolineae bacterium]
MQNRIMIVLVAVALMALTSIGVMAQDETIVDIAAGNEDFSTLVSLVDAAGLVETLSGEGPFTVFAPTNDAFAALPTVLVDYLVANPDVLAQVLTYHVVEGTVLSTDLTEGDVPTVEGNTVAVSLDMGVQINNAEVVTADIEASNGVIHVIDTVILPPAELPEVDPLAVTDNIIAAGSSTVFPLTERMADLFNQDGFAGTITVDSIGSGGGFERFCFNAESDISNASRPIQSEEIEACRANGLEPAEFFVAIDALAIAVSAENDFVDGLTLEELAMVFSGEATTWADINPDWPAETIGLFSPGSDSGTYDYFVEEIFEEDETPIQNAPGIQFSEDDNVLVVGVEGSTSAIAYFGYAYYQENQEVLRAVPIEGVTPSEETGITGEYPLSRPLFIYSAPSIMQEKSQVTAFISYYLQNANAQLGADSDQIGYIPTGEYVGRLNAWTFLAATAGDM